MAAICKLNGNYAKPDRKELVSDHNPARVIVHHHSDMTMITADGIL